jgi:hypothetical protein
VTRPPDSKSKTKQIVFLPKNPEDEKMAENVKKLCLQDDLQIHDFMVEAIGLAFRQHHFPPGNPQLRLDIITQTELSLQAPLTCERCQKTNVPVLYEAVFTSGKKLKECKKCFDAAKEHGLVKKFLRMISISDNERTTECKETEKPGARKHE